MPEIPVRLEHSPIIEALFELRFQPTTNSFVNLLPGMLYPHIKKDFPEIEALPHSMLPEEIRAIEPALQFKATHRMKGDGFAIFIGPNVFSVNCFGPYVGWDSFRDRILNVVQLLSGTKLIDHLDRFSLKYINILPSLKTEPDLGMLDLSMTLGQYNLQRHQTQFRTELQSEHYLEILQVSPKTHGTAPSGEKRSGLLVDVDVISSGSMDGFWANTGERLDAAHDALKNLFFGILTEATLEHFGPVWEENTQ